MTIERMSVVTRSVQPAAGGREHGVAVGDHGVSPAGREALAIALTAREGIDPYSLVPNILDEEPCDGVLPLSGEAHFAWRDRLWRVGTYG